MRVLVTDNAHIYKNKKGEYFTPSIYGEYFFNRYLNVFEEVRFLCKTKYIENLDTSELIKINCKNLEIFEIPWYQGSLGLIKNIIKILKKIKYASIGCNCCIFRVAQIESFLAYQLMEKNIPYALEVVNDPLTFSNKKFVYKVLNIILLNNIIKKAKGISCVTEKYLQKKYLKNSKNKFLSNYSSIELDEIDIANKKKYPTMNEYFTIVHTSNLMIGNEKGNITLIKILYELKKLGVKAKLIFIGDGPSKSEYMELCMKYNLQEYVNFTGRIKSKTIILNILKNSDMFIFPSKTEGLPRSIIEAQASGLPCLASPLGGNLELINKKYLIKSNVEKYVEIIIHLINNPEELEFMSSENIKNARKYLKSKLDKKRNEFYNNLKQCSKSK